MKYHLTLHNDVQEVPLLASFVDEISAANAIDPSTAMSLNLALEEAVANVMNYAYPEGVLANIGVDADFQGHHLVFTITDSGRPFDPTSVTAPDLTLPAEERPIGGLGIMLVHQLMDKVEYHYRDNKNTLILTKNI